VNLRNIALGEKLMRFQIFFASRLMSKKGLRLVYAIFALPIFSFIRRYTCIVAGHTVCEFQKNCNKETKLINTHNANFWENGQKIG